MYGLGWERLNSDLFVAAGAEAALRSRGARCCRSPGPGEAGRWRTVGPRSRAFREDGSGNPRRLWNQGLLLPRRGGTLLGEDLRRVREVRSVFGRERGGGTLEAGREVQRVERVATLAERFPQLVLLVLLLRRGPPGRQ